MREVAPGAAMSLLKVKSSTNTYSLAIRTGASEVPTTVEHSLRYVSHMGR